MSARLELRLVVSNATSRARSSMLVIAFALCSA
jgi:hypothetical protein